MVNQWRLTSSERDAFTVDELVVIDAIANAIEEMRPLLELCEFVAMCPYESEDKR